MNTALTFFPTAASSMAQRVDAIFFALCGVAFFFVVLIALCILVFAIKYRRKRRPNPPARTETFMWLEITWTVIPLIIALSFFAWGGKVFLAEYSNGPKDAYDIFVLGKQWMWKFEHPSGRREINELHIPINQPVRLILVSQDVVHSFFIPALRLKHDVLPMHYTSIWFNVNREGEYHLFCSQYCGTKHADMIGRIVAMAPARFQTWVGQAPSQNSAAYRGNGLLEVLGCRTCHTPDSTAIAPRLEGLFGRDVQLSDGRIVRADENYIRESILNPGAKIVANFQNVMPSFLGRVSEEELMDVIAYLKSIGNKE